MARPRALLMRFVYFTLAIASMVLNVPSAIHGSELLPEDQSIAEVVDHYISARLKQERIDAAPPANDANVLRRTTLDLVGRIPTSSETASYVNDKDEYKRRNLIDRLIGSPAFVRHQVNEFDALLMPDEKNRLREYLLAAFTENRPWDQMFREMMLGQADDPEQKGALQFVKARVGDTDRLTNDVSVTFFGVNVSCAQCHDHPDVYEWSQDRFYGMKSFFNRTFDNGGLLGEHEYGLVSYQTTEGEARKAQLMFLTGAILEEPEVAEPDDKTKKEEKEKLEELKKQKQAPPAPSFSRREQLVEIALKSGENDYFAKAIVNKLWNRFFGYGLVMPLDQMHPENPASHPELLEWLSRDLVAHNYDLSRLVRGIVSSEAYCRSSVWKGSSRPHPDTFAVGSVRPLTPYQYATLLRVATANPDSQSADQKPEDVEARLASLENAARGIAGEIEYPGPEFQVGVAEALFFSNSERVRNDLLRDSNDMLIGKLKKTDDVNELISVATMSIWNRLPDPEEEAALVAYLQSRSDRRDEAIGQMVWAMLTSSECRFNY
ncbi:DUF1549 and DUF1553 domain-containing protein [Blastopirellula sp. JC732]|uniref:DUF1549 and DUF1553 domain-containing protein n=1 Tax=Blastopirellula sediminis TaxID=2894196 RepID=A0A9X1MPF6_9BACT|nr:DUF1549 domain-containing protein [Blastopirellula sediminis]MCC9606201.1 DUF1549 and DUF1553 domain-containing protein [Blastopirellula sediminis]MCC9630501.1 DUF1549 and DUF1553 domain-containing protein [Blastopirellula sediminis]